MIGNTPMSGADERLMMIFLQALVHHDDSGVAQLRTEVAKELAPVFARHIDGLSEEDAFAAMERAVLERGLDAPSAFLPLFFP
jgi:hypothetical protein